MSNGTFTIPEIRCNRHFYGAILCAMRAQAPINEGIVAIEPCAECLNNASAENARLRAALARYVNRKDESASRAKLYDHGKVNEERTVLIECDEQARAALAGGEK